MAARKGKAPATRIQKRGKGHSYYLDGVKAPGVTTVLSNGIPKPALQGWAAKMCAQFVVNRLNVTRNADGDVRIVADQLVEDAYAWNETRDYGRERINRSEPLDRAALEKILTNVRYRDRDEASARGTEVHMLAEKLAAGETVDVPDELAGHVDAYLEFLEDWQPANAMLECVFVNREWCYMGKGDIIADFHHMAWTSGPNVGQPMGRGLLDIKTSRSGIFAETALQTEGYAHCETIVHDDGTESPMPHIDFVGAIWVRADGYDVYTFDRGEDNTGDDTFDTFLYAKAIGEWLDRDGPAGSIKSDSHTAPEPIGTEDD